MIQGLHLSRLHAWALAAILLAGLSAGCSGPQSALDPAGPSAASIHLLGVIMWVGAAAVTLLVTVLFVVPFLKAERPAFNPKAFLWGGGIALPAAALAALVPYVMTVGQDTRVATPADQVSVRVTANRYWWTIDYVLPDGSTVASANELRLPLGEPVELLLASNDVIHSFWVPNLSGKTDLVPGRVNRTVIQVDRPGIYRGQCAEFCGTQHALMAFDVIALPPSEFDAWLVTQSVAIGEPSTAILQQGRDVFLNSGCGGCHTIRGVSEGSLGPDLSSVGARRTIAAGTLPGGAENIASWIAGAQSIKPGNAMPSFDTLAAADLAAVAAYLESLK